MLSVVLVGRSVPVASSACSSSWIRLFVRPLGTGHHRPACRNISAAKCYIQPCQCSDRSPKGWYKPQWVQNRLLHCTFPMYDASESRAAPEKSTPVKEVQENSQGSTETPKISQGQRMKLAVREYGATVIVFHTCISLFTLGVSYAAVSSGLDVVGLLSKIGVGQSMLESRIATGASTFVIAYAVHKVFAPARMATTLAATPFIVRYLRRVGILKRPPPKP